MFLTTLPYLRNIQNWQTSSSQNVLGLWIYSKRCKGRMMLTVTRYLLPHTQDPISTLLHEIQHWIQDKETFATGGNQNSAVAALLQAQKELQPKSLLPIWRSNTQIR